ncbi:nitrogen regulation protein NR(I) [Alphaproteobacteria bacterium]|nr:nitrogen regulation protein NR(I) [Alphaproteobacteria bacterium]MDC1156687.1 nitrogen regulation protein NR(I) [Alphaproteobacteria bacterium]
MNAKPPLILVAEDDKSVRLVVQQALARQGYAVQSSGTAAGLWKLIESGKGDVLITDIALPDGDALDLLPRIQERRPDLPVIVMSARSTLLTAVKAQQVGVFEYLPKPFELRSLIEVTQRAVETIGTPSRSSTKTASIEEGGPLIGRSRPMQDIFKAMARVVSTDLTVLVTGESGTGKELVARALHDLGSRRAGPFVAINLAAIPRDLVEAELFGRAKDDGSSPAKHHQGRFEQAEGGTLFLDEVGDMPPEAQTRLLRVLQDGEYLPVGAQRSVKTNIRVIAATNQNLHHLMHQGLFREDLFYRLNVVPLRLPPLRERIEDIGPLVAHFQLHAVKEGLPSKTFTPEALRALKSWHWPGNVRELENQVRRMLVLHADNSIDAAAVEHEFPASQADLNEDAESLSESVDAHIRRYFEALKGGMPASGLYGRILREVEHPLILATLEVTRGNQVRAADILGLNRNTLRKKIKDLNIKAGR